MDLDEMKDYHVVDGRTEGIRIMSNELCKIEDVCLYYHLLRDLRMTLDAYSELESLTINDASAYMKWRFCQHIVYQAAMNIISDRVRIQKRLKELSDYAALDDTFFVQYNSLWDVCDSLSKEVERKLWQIYNTLGRLLDSPRLNLIFRKWIDENQLDSKTYASVRSELIRAYCKARSCDGQAMTRDAWQSILDETRHLVEAQLGGRTYEPEVYLTPEDLRSLIGRHAALYRCIDDTMIDTDGVFDVSVAIDMHNLLDHWNNENYGKLRPLLACRQVIGDGLRGAKPRREAARKAHAAAAVEAQPVSSLTRCFFDTSDAMRERVRRIVGQHYTGQPAALSLIEWALYGAQVIRVESEHRLFIEALVEWGVIGDPGPAKIERMCSTMSTKTSRLRQKISSSDQKRIEEIREGVKG